MTTPNSLALEAIVASKTNPRKHFDAAALKELAESIAKHGVLQAILVRPNGADGKFELVAGERRWRAAKLAQLDRIPVTVRELSDTEALELQVVENLQRTDLHPLEEAEGYESLMKCQHADGRTYTADEIAAKVGKSRSYVYSRLKYTALCKEARVGVCSSCQDHVGRWDRGERGRNEALARLQHWNDVVGGAS